MRRTLGRGVKAAATAGALAALLAGCAGVGRGAGSSPAEATPFAGLGVELQLKTTIGLLPDPKLVLVARSDFWAGLDETRFVPSWRCSENRCYVRDPGPGTWVVVAVAHDAVIDQSGRIRSGHVTCLSRQDAERTSTVLPRDGFAFMGRFTIDESLGFGDADELQRRCRSAITGYEHPLTKVLRFAGQEFRYWHRGAITEEARDGGAADAFLKHAPEDLPRFTLAPQQPAPAP